MHRCSSPSTATRTGCPRWVGTPPRGWSRRWARRPTLALCLLSVVGRGATTRASERQKADILKQPIHLGQLLLPTDEAGEPQWKVVGRTLQRAWGGFHGAKPPRILGRGRPSGNTASSPTPGGAIAYSYSHPHRRIVVALSMHEGLRATTRTSTPQIPPSAGTRRTGCRTEKSRAPRPVLLEPRQPGGSTDHFE